MKFWFKPICISPTTVYGMSRFSGDADLMGSVISVIIGRSAGFLP